MPGSRIRSGSQQAVHLIVPFVPWQDISHVALPHGSLYLDSHVSSQKQEFCKREKRGLGGQLANLLPAWCSGPPFGPQQGSSFLVGIHTANNETDAEIETVQALFNGQRMEKQELSLQINFQSGGDQKARFLKVGLMRGGIYTGFLGVGGVFPGTGVPPLFLPSASWYFLLWPRAGPSLGMLMNYGGCEHTVRLKVSWRQDLPPSQIWSVLTSSGGISFFLFQSVPVRQR